MQGPWRQRGPGHILLYDPPGAQVLSLPLHTQQITDCWSGGTPQNSSQRTMKPQEPHIHSSHAAQSSLWPSQTFIFHAGHQLQRPRPASWDSHDALTASHHLQYSVKNEIHILRHHCTSPQGLFLTLLTFSHYSIILCPPLNTVPWLSSAAESNCIIMNVCLREHLSEHLVTLLQSECSLFSDSSLFPVWLRPHQTVCLHILMIKQVISND